MCVCVFVCVCMVKKNFYCLHDNLKNTGEISSIFVCTLGLGKHEFAFGFCGSCRVEINRLRNLVVGIHALRAILFIW